MWTDAPQLRPVHLVLATQLMQLLLDFVQLLGALPCTLYTLREGQHVLSVLLGDTVQDGRVIDRRQGGTCTLQPSALAPCTRVIEAAVARAPVQVSGVRI